MDKREVIRIADRKLLNVVLSAGGNVNIFTPKGTIRLDQKIRSSGSSFVPPCQREGDTMAAPTTEGYLLADGGKIFRQDRDGNLIGDFPFPSGQIRVMPGLRGPVILCLCPQATVTPSNKSKLIKTLPLPLPKSAMAGEGEKKELALAALQAESESESESESDDESGSENESEKKSKNPEQEEEEEGGEVFNDTLVQALDFDLRPLFSTKLLKTSILCGDFTSSGDFIGVENSQILFFRGKDSSPYFKVETGFHVRSILVSPRDEIVAISGNNVLYVGADGRKKEEVKSRNFIVGATLDLDGDILLLEKESQGEIYHLYNLVPRRRSYGTVK